LIIKTPYSKEFLIALSFYRRANYAIIVLTQQEKEKNE
jgi:hypothetical protein